MKQSLAFHALAAISAFCIATSGVPAQQYNNFPIPSGNVAAGSHQLPAMRAIHVYAEDNVTHKINNNDPTLRLGAGTEGIEQVWGHLSMTSSGTPGLYSSLSGMGDLVLQADITAEDLIVTNRNDEGMIRFATTPAGSSKDKERMTIHSNGNVGIGTSNPQYKLTIASDVPALWVDYFPSSYWTYGTLLQVNAPEAIASATKVLAIASTAVPGEFDMFSVLGNGNTRIRGKLWVGNDILNISSPHFNDLQASIGGKLVVKELVCTIYNWSDFVFEDDYKLRPLEEVEQHIREHKHLPEIPAAAEVQNDGLALGEFQAKLLQKVEELTLYLIEQNKEINQLRNENIALQSAIAQLQSK